MDLYLIHYPVRLRQGIGGSISKGDVLPFDIKGTWEAMEECSKLGLTKSIGVSNFGAKSFQNFCRMQLLPLLLIRYRSSWLCLSEHYQLAITLIKFYMLSYFCFNDGEIGGLNLVFC